MGSRRRKALVSYTGLVVVDSRAGLLWDTLHFHVQGVKLGFMCMNGMYYNKKSTKETPPGLDFPCSTSKCTNNPHERQKVANIIPLPILDNQTICHLNERTKCETKFHIDQIETR